MSRKCWHMKVSLQCLCTALLMVVEPNSCSNTPVTKWVPVDLTEIIWLSANKLTLNLTKTEFVLVGSRQKLSKLSATPSFMINDHPVMEVSTAKSLGVHIDQNLSWECHIQSICKKIASALGAIKRIRHLIPFNVLINVYDNLIQPHFDYCKTSIDGYYDV